MYTTIICMCIYFMLVQSCTFLNFKSEDIVPELLDEEPPSKLNVIYANAFVDNGKELTPTEVKDEPSIEWDADPKKYYLLMMIEPDAPSRTDKSLAIVNHWLVGNIPGNNLKSPEADVILDFVSSGPGKDTGLHRYIFLLYEQNEKLVFDEPRVSSTSLQHRFHFNLHDFTKKYNLGSPIAGNFYQAQWDAYVEELYKKLEKW